MWFIGVEVEQETSAPPPNKNPGSAPQMGLNSLFTPKTKTTKKLFVKRLFAFSLGSRVQSRLL